MIRACCFDMGGVLTSLGDPEIHRRWEARLGLPPKTLGRALWSGPEAHEAMTGKMTYRELLAIQRARLGLSEPEFEQLMRDVWTGQFDADLLTYIRALRPRVKTAVLSNAFSGSRRAVQTHVNESVFDVLIFSADVGLAKPDPAIYHLALERLGVPPQEATFVDDLEENVLAANALGMHGILFLSASQVRAELDALLAAE